MRRKIYGFFHIATMNHWKSVVEELLYEIEKSGLLDNTKKIFYSVVGEEFKLMLDKTENVFYNKNFNYAEIPIIDFCHKFCKKNENSSIWYIHTKGVSFSNNYNVECWRKYMTYFIINNYEICLKELEMHDICGVDWYEKNNSFIIKNFNRHQPHFSGNFWWGNSNYIKKLPELDYSLGRMAAEFFIGSGENPNVKSLHNSNNLHYSFPYEKNKYIKNKII